MSATVIAFISQKGGVGKSTLCRAVAREAANGGLRVKVADLDTQQGTTANWQRKRLHAEIDPPISVEAYGGASQALRDSDRYDLLLLDGPARASRGTLEIAQRSNIVVQPTGASVDDLEPGVITFHDLVKAGIPRERLVFALERLGTEAEEAETREYLAKAGYAVLEGAMFERPAYRRAQNLGLAVTETQFATLNKRADQLVQNIIDRTN